MSAKRKHRQCPRSGTAGCNTTDTPLPETGNRPWQKPHLPNLTGTLSAYRPPGHDYRGGHRAAADGERVPDAKSLAGWYHEAGNATPVRSRCFQWREDACLEGHHACDAHQHHRDREERTGLRTIC